MCLRRETQVAKELAAAEIPVILTENRGAPDSFRDKDVVVGPPLTPSIARYLTEAGVEFAVALHAWRTFSSDIVHGIMS